MKFYEIKNVDVLESAVAVMHARCDEAEAQLQATSEACSSLLLRADGLRAER